VVVKPAANLARLEEVLVITDITDHMPAAEQQDIAESLAEADKQKRAADILSERLPGLKDPNAPPVDPNAVPVPTDGDPGRPPKPGVALHPDRFSPDSTPPANTLTPGQTTRSAPAQGTGVESQPSTQGTAPAGGTGGVPHAARPAQSPASGTAAPGTTTPGTTAPRKPKVILPDGTVSQPAAPRATEPKPAQPKTTEPPPNSQPQQPPGGRL